MINKLLATGAIIAICFSISIADQASDTFRRDINNMKGGYSRYSTATQLKFNAKLNITSFANYSTIGRVPEYRTVNSQALTGNITLNSSDVGAESRTAFQSYSTATQGKLDLKLNQAVFNSYTSIDRVPTTRTVNGQALSGDVTVTTITGNAGTATALAANGTNCSAGQSPLGVDASGNSEGCYAVQTPLVAGTDYLAPNGSAAALTSFPTLNQNTTGSAAKWTTGRTVAITGPITYTSPSLDGSGNVTAAAAVANQTGTGSKFVMDTSPTFAGTVTMPLNSYLMGGATHFGYFSSTRNQLHSGSTSLRINNQADTVVLVEFPNTGGIAINSGGSANTVVCWKSDGKTLGYATVSEITAGTCH